MSATILFVEDNEDLRENAALVLELEGYTVYLARDGRDALNLLDEGLVPHLIVSDIMMPHMDGYEFFEAVRQRPELKAIPFIFLTARGSRRDISTGRLMGADDYLVKPFDPDDFLIAVQNKLRRAEEIRAQATESLNGARRALVQLMSHELRTPLTYVTGGFALLAEELERQTVASDSEDIRVSLNLIQSGTQRLNRLAEQMVLYSEIISGFTTAQVKHASEEVSLEDLLGDALELAYPLAEQNEIVIEQIRPGHAPLVLIGVKDLLLVALGEVIRNAVQYSYPGGRVQIAWAQEEQTALITVIDHGPGIPPEDQQTIWDVLIQSGRERTEQQGIGMGLPIARGVVLAHSGDITLYSVPGQGTEVTLRLPLFPAA